ncbi:MAG: hypothetical protein RBR35_04590 [Salinivirgaceae bacterium]|nr:hypothetical protein [Salinivirgaceae bacterium]
MESYKKQGILFLALFLIAVFVAFFHGLGLNKMATYVIEGEIVTTHNWSSISLLLLGIVIGFVVGGLFIVKSSKESYFSSIKKISGIPYCLSGQYIKYLPVFIGALLLALLQVYTIWDFRGEEVDENAVFHFAVGFFGGDFNPHWTGYGGFGMYLLYFVYMILYIPFYIFGNVSSIEEYGMQLFYNDYFLLVARYVFAVAGIIGVLFYSRLLKQIGIPIILVFVFILASILHYDAIFFANYIRTDQLVMMFVAASIYFAVNSHKKSNLFFLAISVAGAIASKISAIPLIGLLGIYVIYRLYDKTISWKYMIWIGLVFVGALLLFQPYTNMFTKILQIFGVGMDGYEGGKRNLDWSYHETVLERAIVIYDYFAIYVSKPILFSLVLLPFARKYLKVLIPALITLILLIAPYLTALTLKYYWFIPAFALVKFLSFLGIYAFTLFVFDKVSVKVAFVGKYKSWLLSGVLVLFVGSLVIYPSMNDYLDKYKWIPTNQKMAEKFIIENLIETDAVVLDGNRFQYLPKIYSPDNIRNSRNISRSFMHKRTSNEFLSTTFEHYLQNHYLARIGVDSIMNVTQYRFSKKNSIDYKKYLLGKYFVTMPFIYKTPLRKSAESELRQYYRFITSNHLEKRFENGHGRVIEIYHITKQ